MYALFRSFSTHLLFPCFLLKPLKPVLTVVSAPATAAMFAAAVAPRSKNLFTPGLLREARSALGLEHDVAVKAFEEDPTFIAKSSFNLLKLTPARGGYGRRTERALDFTPLAGTSSVSRDGGDEVGDEMDAALAYASVDDAPMTMTPPVAAMPGPLVRTISTTGGVKAKTAKKAPSATRRDQPAGSQVYSIVLACVQFIFTSQLPRLWLYGTNSPTNTCLIF